MVLYQTKHIGRIIREVRFEKKLTIEFVAELCDMSVRGYEKIELGNSDPKWSTVVKIAGALEMDLGILSSCVSYARIECKYYEIKS